MALENPKMALENQKTDLENPKMALENPKMALENPKMALENPEKLLEILNALENSEMLENVDEDFFEEDTTDDETMPVAGNGDEIGRCSPRFSIFGKLSLGVLTVSALIPGIFVLRKMNIELIVILSMIILIPLTVISHGMIIFMVFKGSSVRSWKTGLFDILRMTIIIVLMGFAVITFLPLFERKIYKTTFVDYDVDDDDDEDWD